MFMRQNGPVRLNIYIHDPDIRRQIKAVAAKRDISVSDYCLRAITNQLVKEEEIGREEANPLKTGLEKARKFQTKTFGGKVFSVSSAELIRESRESRNKL
jgi:hypothetical protein